MTRGGYREGAGRKSSWNNSETQLIRVPRMFSALLLHIARRLDHGEPLADVVLDEDDSNSDSVTELYNQDTLYRIAQDIVADEALISNPQDKQVAQRVLTTFIDRLMPERMSDMSEG